MMNKSSAAVGQVDVSEDSRNTASLSDFDAVAENVAKDTKIDEELDINFGTSQCSFVVARNIIKSANKRSDNNIVDVESIWSSNYFGVDEPSNATFDFDKRSHSFLFEQSLERANNRPVKKPRNSSTIVNTSICHELVEVSSNQSEWLAGIEDIVNNNKSICNVYRHIEAYEIDDLEYDTNTGLIPEIIVLNPPAIHPIVVPPAQSPSPTTLRQTNNQRRARAGTKTVLHQCRPGVNSHPYASCPDCYRNGVRGVQCTIPECCNGLGLLFDTVQDSNTKYHHIPTEPKSTSIPINKGSVAIRRIRKLNSRYGSIINLAS